MTRRGDTYDMFQPRERGRFGDNEQALEAPAGRSDLIDLDMVMLSNNDAKAAVCVSPNGSWDRAVWLPRRLIEVGHTGAPITINGKPRQRVRITLPKWKAKQEGLM